MAGATEDGVARRSRRNGSFSRHLQRNRCFFPVNISGFSAEVHSFLTFLAVLSLAVRQMA